MHDAVLIVLAIVGVSVAAALPLLAYALLPPDTLNLLSQHGRFSGLGTEQANRPAGNSPVPATGSLQAV
jgi:hypothetical protein